RAARLAQRRPFGVVGHMGSAQHDAVADDRRQLLGQGDGSKERHGRSAHSWHTTEAATEQPESGPLKLPRLSSVFRMLSCRPASETFRDRGGTFKPGAGPEHGNGR